MPSDKDLKLRQEILKEWRAKTNAKKALKKIRAKWGKQGVTINKVKHWFRRFEKGDTSLFRTKSSMNVSVQDNSDGSFAKHSVDSILVVIDDKILKLNKPIYTSDGRFAVSIDINSRSYITFYDLFHGAKKSIKVADNSAQPTSNFYFGIAGDYLLEICDNSFHIYKVNFDTWEINALFSQQFNGLMKIVFDQLNNHKFLISNSWHMDTIQTGQIIDDRIELSEVKIVGNFFLRCMALIDNKLRGFNYDDYQNASSLKFYEINLGTMQQTKFDSSVPIEIQGSFMEGMSYSWIGNRCYAIFTIDHSRKKKLLSFNLDTRLWSDTQVSVKNVSQLFVDANQVLTLQDKNTFYRISLKKPECLKNLAWFKILRNSKLIRSKIYDKIAHRLPYNCNLRCLFGNDNEEEE